MTIKGIKVLGAMLGASLVLAVGCSDSSSPTKPSSSSASHVFTSSSAGGHTHTATLTKVEVETPPVSGITRDTSSSGGHTHSFSMSEAQLTSVKGGGTETIATSVVNSHSHTFTISKWY